MTTSPYFPPTDRWSQILADDREAARMAGTLTESVEPILPPGIQLPQVVHFTSSTQLLGQILDYGDELTITEDMLPALADRLGHVSVLDLLDDPEAQRSRFGTFRIRRGPWPADVSKTLPGSAVWITARLDFYAWARSLPFESERDLALAEARKRFGPSEFGPCPASIIARAYGFEPE